MKILQICLLLALVFWQGWSLSGSLDTEYDLRPVEPATPWEATVSDPVATALPARPAQLGTIMSAAVFSPTRQLKAKPKPLVKAPARPVAVNAPAPVVREPERASLRLEGVMMSSSEQMALVRVADTEERKWIRLGEKFKGWTLIEISALEVVVESGKSRSKLPLYVDNR